MIKIGTVYGDVIEAGGVKNVTNNYYGEASAQGAQPADQMPSQEQLARAIEACYAFFWANSAHAVLFCLLRDQYGMADNMSQFEAWVERLPYVGKRSYTCPKGTVVNAFSNNPVFKLPIDKWEGKASRRALKLLEELRARLEL